MRGFSGFYSAIFAAKKCFEFGLSLGHVRVIPDQRDEIVSSVRELSSKYSLVFTSGGIGKPIEGDYFVPYSNPLKDLLMMILRMNQLLKPLKFP